jgi:nucleotide-binding universal stress UspA family protein
MSSQSDRAPVIVGYDGSEAAKAAVRVAADEAALRGLSLRILHVAGMEQAGLGVTSATLLEEAAELARPLLPPSRLSVAEVAGDAAAGELIARSARAELVVVGCGRVGVFGALLGSVALEVVNGALCHVVVVRQASGTGPGSGGVVVVGIDGIAESEDALAAAFEEANVRSVDLVAVHAWHIPTSSGPGDMVPLVYDPLGLEADETAMLRDAVRPFREKYPSVAVTEQISEGATARTLVELSADARVLVVGSRGRGPVKSLLLGSVSQAVVRHARCPVLVARAQRPT